MQESASISPAASAASAHESFCGLAPPHQEQTRELGPAFEEGSALPPGLTVCWGQNHALLPSGGWIALAGGTDDSWMKSQLVADALEEGLHMQGHVSPCVGSLIVVYCYEKPSWILVVQAFHVEIIH